MSAAPYHRTAAQRQLDHLASKEWEAEVFAQLGDGWTDHTASTTRLDFYHAQKNVWLDCKEKRQPLTERWWLIGGTPEYDLFVLDELSVRKALVHYPAAYFLLKDCPTDRLFLVSVAELACVERVRVNRVGKGKWILDLMNLQAVGSVPAALKVIDYDLQHPTYLNSECLGKNVGQV